MSKFLSENAAGELPHDLTTKFVLLLKWTESKSDVVRGQAYMLVDTLYKQGLVPVNDVVKIVVRGFCADSKE